jgi:hypothetical protein
VPTVAATYWNVSLDEVMRRVRDNAVTHKQELGFTLIDVAPDAPVMQCGTQPAAFNTHTPPAPPPQTFVAAEAVTEAVQPEEIPVAAGNRMRITADAAETDSASMRIDTEPQDRAATELRLQQAVLDGDWRKSRELLRNVRVKRAA